MAQEETGKFDLVVVGKDNFPVLNERIRRALSRKTPQKFIMKRPDGFDYVEVGYVRRFLDELFPGSWDIQYDQMTPWEVIKATRQLVVKATLTIYNPFTRERIRTVEAFGGGPMKVYKKGKCDKEGLLMEGLPIDFGNDYKSASADALKKAASMLGICQDIYEPKVEAKMKKAEPQEQQQEERKEQPAPTPEPVQPEGTDPRTKISRGSATALAKAYHNKGYSDDNAKDYLQIHFQKASLMDLTIGECNVMMADIAAGKFV